MHVADLCTLESAPDIGLSSSGHAQRRADLTRLPRSTRAVTEVATAVAECDPPQVFGVHGDWGLGKTSFLHQVQWYLTGECPQQSESETQRASRTKGVYYPTVRAVWFDAWRYQNEDAPIVALLHEIRSQLSWPNQLPEKATRAAKVLWNGALLSIEELTKKIGFQYSKFRDANREWRAENMSTPLPSYTLRELLRIAIKKLLPDQSTDGNTPRVAIFIDDLDRCDPESAYRLLEGLKIYLTLDNCVFILGMNQKAIEEAISSRMESVPRGLRPQRATAYLEKLCQNVWRLPIVQKPSDVLFHLLELPDTNNNRRKLIKHAVEVEGHQCLPPNPRRLKGLANLVDRMSDQLPSSDDENDPLAIRQACLLMVVAYIYQFHQDLYARWEADPNLYREIVHWCNGEKDPNLTFFNQMMLPKQRPTSDSDQRDLRRPEISIEPQNVYPNPTEASIFWIQPMIRELGIEVSPDDFKRYLHSVPR